MEAKQNWPQFFITRQTKFPLLKRFGGADKCFETTKRRSTTHSHDSKRLIGLKGFNVAEPNLKLKIFPIVTAASAIRSRT